MALPGSGAAALDVASEGLAEFAENFGGFSGDVGGLLGIAFEVIEFQRAEGIVLRELPVATDEGFVVFAAIGCAAFTSDEIEVARCGDRLAFEERDEADGIKLGRGRASGELEEGGEEVEVEALVVAA